MPRAYMRIQRMYVETQALAVFYSSCRLAGSTKGARCYVQCCVIIIYSQRLYTLEVQKYYYYYNIVTDKLGIYYAFCSGRIRYKVVCNEKRFRMKIKIMTRNILGRRCMIKHYECINSSLARLHEYITLLKSISKCFLAKLN